MSRIYANIALADSTSSTPSTTRSGRACCVRSTSRLTTGWEGNTSPTWSRFVRNKTCPLCCFTSSWTWSGFTIRDPCLLSTSHNFPLKSSLLFLIALTFSKRCHGDFNQRHVNAERRAQFLTWWKKMYFSWWPREKLDAGVNVLTPCWSAASLGLCSGGFILGWRSVMWSGPT